MAKSNKAFPNFKPVSKLALAIICANSALAMAGPTGGSVATGIATISTTTTNTTINQSSEIVTIDWSTFNVGTNETVVFNQLSSDVAINNIHDSSPSNIQGSITGDGTIFLSNTNGFIFGAGSSINTGAFLATTSDINFDVTDTIKLTDNSVANSSISIHKDASINANQQSEGGYLAFISRQVLTDSSPSDGNVNSGLHAEKGEVLISNDVESTIKLSGLNINFPGSNFTGASEFNLDLTGANITAEKVILTSKGLTDILNSVVNQPPSITTDNLIVSSSDLGTSPTEISTGISNAIGIANSSQLELGSLTVNYTHMAPDLGPDPGPDTIVIEQNIGIENGTNLIFNTDGEVSFSGSVSGLNSDLTVNANTVNIGYIADSFGGFIGLQNLTINAAATNLFGNIHTTNNISISGPTTVYRDSTLVTTIPYKTKLISDNGKITLADDLIFGGDSSQPYDLYMLANDISLQKVTGFGAISLNANHVTLNGDIDTAGTMSIDNTSNDYVNIEIADLVKISADNMDFEDFYFTSSDNSNSLTLDVRTNKQVKLINSTTSDLNALNSLTINNSASETNVLISGDWDINKFDTSNNYIFKFELDGDTSFTNIDNLDLSNTSLTGSYLFSVVGNSASAALFGRINNLKGFTLSGLTNTTLHNDISTQESGLSITSENIILAGDANTISITNNDGGNIVLDGSISSDVSDASDPSRMSSLNIDTKNSDLYLGSISKVNNLTINKQLKDEGKTSFAGNISVSGNLTASNLGTINTTDDITLTGDVISITDSHINAESHDISFEANGGMGSITTDLVTANNISLNGDTLTLYGDLTASDGLKFFNDSTSKNVAIELKNDITLSGNVDFLSTNNTQATITGDKNLSIVSKNDNIHLSTFNTVGGLNSLSITTASTDTSSKVFFAVDAEGNIIMPELNGVEGLSLLGNMDLSFDSSIVPILTFDTSSYDGNLNLSGVNINGAGVLTFDTGTGELSLGDIGTNPLVEADILTSLVINSTGKLNLHGDLNIVTDSYNFSRLNSIELYTDLILGNALLPLVEVNFGMASINGTHDLTLYTSALTLGAVGNNIALQDLTIVSDGNLELSNDISTVGMVDINSASITLDNTISSAGLSVKITTENDLIMSKDSQIMANYGNITLASNTGNIGIGELTAGFLVTLRSELGYLYNNIDDYISNDSTSTNITSTDLDLYGLINIGESVDKPIVVNVQNSGTIKAESAGTVHIANLANANIETDSRLIDSSAGGSTASTDAYTQFKLSSLNTVNLPTVNSTLGLISNLTWQLDEDENIRKIKSPASAPAIHYSRNGWRLGHK
ncbi:MAG: filamentous hemagglutinin family protein [Psychrobacter glaciei]|jgi:filamentous hemagglutinin family protein